MSISFVPQIDIIEMVLVAVIKKPYKTGVCSIYPSFMSLFCQHFGRWKRCFRGSVFFKPIEIKLGKIKVIEHKIKIASLLI